MAEVKKEYSAEEIMGLLKSGKATIPDAAPKKEYSSDEVMAMVESGQATIPTSIGNKAQTALESSQNMATLGYLPQIQAGAEYLANKAAGYIPGTSQYSDEVLRRKGFSVPEQTYTQMRDENSARIQGNEQANPYAATLGKVGGFAEGLIAPAFNVASKAGVAAKALAGAKTGALYGAIQNPGDTPGEVGLQLEDRAKNTALGGAIGAVAPVAIEKLIIPAAKGIIKTPGEFIKGLKGIPTDAEIAAATKLAEQEAAGQTPQARSGVASIASNAKESGSAVVKGIAKIFNPKQAPDYADMIAIAEKNGIDPTILPASVEFGPSSIITRGERARAEGISGEQTLEKFQDALSSVQQATDRRIQSMAGGMPTNKVEAGQTIRDGFRDAFDNAISKDAITYASVQKYAPGLRLNTEAKTELGSTLSGLEKWAKGRTVRGITATQKQQGMQVLTAINAVKQTKGKFKQVIEAMDMVGDVAFPKVKENYGDIPANLEKFQDLYMNMRQAVIKTVKKDVNPEFATELIENNKKMSQIFKDRQLVTRSAGNEAVAPERVFDSVVLQGDTNKIAALKRILSPEQLQQVKGAFVENLIKRSDDGSFNFKTFYKALRNKRPVAEALFEPSELNDIGELIKLGDRFGQPILSTSGTGASFSFKDISANLQSRILNDTLLDTLKQNARAKGLVPPSGPRRTK